MTTTQGRKPTLHLQSLPRYLAPNLFGKGTKLEAMMEKLFSSLTFTSSQTFQPTNAWSSPRQLSHTSWLSVILTQFSCYPSGEAGDSTGEGLRPPDCPLPTLGPSYCHLSRRVGTRDGYRAGFPAPSPPRIRLVCFSGSQNPGKRFTR